MGLGIFWRIKRLENSPMLIILAQFISSPSEIHPIHIHTSSKPPFPLLLKIQKICCFGKMSSTFPPFKLPWLGLILALVMSTQFQQTESLLEKIPNLKFWDNKFAYEKLGQVKNDLESQANSQKAESALKNKPNSKQARLDIKALKNCEKNFGKLEDVKNHIKSILANYKELATTLANRDDFNTYLSNLKATIRQQKREYKHMGFVDVYHDNEQQAEDEKKAAKNSIKFNEAKFKLLKQLNEHGYQAFMSAYEICNERVEETQGENAMEARLICYNYLGKIKDTFKAAGIDLDSIKKEANAKQRDEQQKYMKILEDCQKLAEAGQLKQVGEEMRKVLETYKSPTYMSNVLGNWESFSQYLGKWKRITELKKSHGKRPEEVTQYDRMYGGQVQIRRYEENLNMLEKLRDNNGYKTVVLAKEICAGRLLDKFKKEEKTKANEICGTYANQLKQLFKDVLGEEKHNVHSEWIGIENLKSG